MAAPSDDDDEGREWEYSLADLEDDDDAGDEASDERGPSAEDGETPYEAIDRSIEPEEIDLENAAFVALGALVGVLIVLRTATVFVG
ncbi:hypothetical protein ACFQDG_15195 [Natronoarchaeum mannanilyticum]|uniref:DUF7312 domain-containing protein n=1 Tax=Natronoarchaeum mannanilyticum TaxID=926360 RepID=A0AAV3T4S1_9EURY